MTKPLLFLLFFFLNFSNISIADQNDQVIEIVKRWNELHNTRETEHFKVLYAPTVLYYGRYDSRQKCYNSKRKNLSPKFSQEIVSPIEITFYSSGTAKCNFIKRVTNKQIVKEYECYLLIQNINGNYYVTGEGDLITDNKLNVKLDLGDPLNNTGYKKYIVSVGLLILVAGGGAVYYMRKREERNMFVIEKPIVQDEVQLTEENIIAQKEDDSDIILKVKEAVLKDLKEAGFEESSPQGKGFAFESYVVDLFRSEYFTLEEWRSDKYHNGKYPKSSLDPDLVYNFKTKFHRSKLAIECKWRAGFKNGQIEWANNRQLSSYRNFQKHHRMPVFVVIGIGGEPSKPEALYVIPLDHLHSGFLNEHHIKKYFRYRTGYFYYNTHSMTLE